MNCFQADWEQQSQDITGKAAVQVIKSCQEAEKHQRVHDKTVSISFSKMFYRSRRSERCHILG